MEYVFEGPGPVERDGGIIRPGDVRDFATEPDWGPWRPVAGQQGGVPDMQRADVTEVPAAPSGPVTVPLMTAAAAAVPLAPKGA
jgi:hypothetical protein